MKPAKRTIEIAYYPRPHFRAFHDRKAKIDAERSGIA